MDVPLVVVLFNTTLVSDSLQVKPVDGETLAVNATVPVNPCRPAAVIVEVPLEPARTVRPVGLPATEKS